MRTNLSVPLLPLIAGDAIILAIFTLIGFASHGELNGSGSRLLSTYIPVCLAWAVVSPWLGLFHADIVRNPLQLWRVPVAAVIAAPLAGWLRGIALNATVLPIFIFVMAGTLSLMLVIWRGAWLFISSRQVQHG